MGQADDVTVRRVTVRSDGRPFGALVVGQHGPTDPGAMCPVVAFGHGFAQDAGRYLSILTGLAARGYVVVAPDSETRLWPSHARLADDLWRAIEWARSSSPHADPAACAVAGHSMGAGAALLAAQRHTDIDTVVTFAAARTRPSSVAAAAAIRADALFVVGSLDRIVRPETTRTMYAAKPTPATFVTITGGYHCGFLDSAACRGLGCDSGDLTRDAQLAITRQLLGDWLDSRLRGRPLPPWPDHVVVESR
ncbi:dienelactone hydrolase family protein [Intrasporangium oryzae]|nr:alpha/beta hydrolase [Intrasporangium oryzae]